MAPEGVKQLSLREHHDPGAGLSLGPEHRIWTCDPRQQVKVFDANTGDMLESHEVTGTPTCLAAGHKTQFLIMGMSSGKVDLNSLPDCSFEEFIARCTAPVRDVQYSPSDAWVAAASEDMELRLIDAKSMDVTMLKKHDGGVRSVCFDPKEELLASLGMDGQLVIWSLADKTSVFSSKIMERELPQSDKHPKVVVRASWSPDGATLAVPGSRSLTLVERGTWKVTRQPTESSPHTHEIRVVTWGDGLVATAGRDGLLVIWDATRMTPTNTFSTGDGREPISDMVWTQAGTLAMMDTAGRFGIEKGITKPPAAPATSATVTASEPARKAKGHTSLDDSTTKAHVSRMLDDEASDRGNEEDDPKDVGGVTHGKRANDEDDEEEEAPVDHDDDPPQDDDEHDQLLQAVAPMQGPFVSSSSPLDAPKRYLVWNTVGSIVSQDVGDHNAVEVEFADSTRRMVRFTDHYRFVMGALSEEGAVFASSLLSEAEGATNKTAEQSTIFYRPLVQYSTKAQWLYTLPADESALCVAAGSRWAAVATNKQWVRLFTFSGVQDDIIALPGPVVTLTGRGHMLAIFFHGGSPMNESQAIHYQVLDMNARSMVASGPLPLTPKSLLTWAGLNEFMMPLIMDSEGMLFALVKSFGWQWWPVLDTSKLRKSPMDLYWAVGVYNNSLMCTLLKGGDLHPAISPKPLVSALPLKVPLIMHDQAFSRFEESNMITKMTLSHRTYAYEALVEEAMDPEALADAEGALIHGKAQYDKGLLKMLQASAATENADRVMELADMLHLERSIELAIRVADHCSMPHVAARVSELLALKYPPVVEEAQPPPEADEQLTDHVTGSPMSNDEHGFHGGTDVEDAPQDDPIDEKRPPLELGKSKSASDTQRTSANKSKPRPAASSPAPAPAAQRRNPFAVKEGKTAAEKRLRGIAESLGSLVGSPSPKRAVLSRSSSFAHEIRSKRKHDKS